MTKSGKTTFVKELIRRLRTSYTSAALYIIDSKGQGDFDEFPGFDYSEKAPRPIKPGGTQVWQPPDDDLDEYDAYLQGILKSRPKQTGAIVVIDELSSIAPNPNNCPPGLQRILKQGRGLNISVLCLTQEACYIPRQVLGQTTHLVRLRLQNPEDAIKLDKLLQRVGQGEPTRLHGFIYSCLESLPRTAIEYDDFRDFFGKAA